MKRYRFEAAIQRSTGWGAYVLFPHDTEKEFGIRGRVPVQALLGGLPYSGSLMMCGTEHHLLAVPKSIRDALSKQPGDRIRVELWKDDSPRTVEVSQEFAALLLKHKLLADFESLSLTRRKQYRNWITSAKREDTRLRRMEKSIELLKVERKKEG